MLKEIGFTIDFDLGKAIEVYPHRQWFACLTWIESSNIKRECGAEEGEFKRFQVHITSALSQKSGL
jgi:hypothetical protein